MYYVFIYVNLCVYQDSLYPLCQIQGSDTISIPIISNIYALGWNMFLLASMAKVI